MDKVNRSLNDLGWNHQNTKEIKHLKNSKSVFYAHILFSRNNKALALVVCINDQMHFSRIKKEIKQYAQNIEVPYIFLTDGDVNIIWDIIEDDARLISMLFSQNDLERKSNLIINKNRLSNLPLNDIEYLRNYQIDAIKSIDKAIDEGKRELFIQMAVGSGKTYVISQTLIRLFEAEIVKKTLIIVDTTFEGLHIKDSLRRLIPQLECNLSMSGDLLNTSSHIVISTRPILSRRYDELPSGFFDLIIMSDLKNNILTNNFNSVISYFDALNITFSSFPINVNEYDFMYTLENAINDGVLAPIQYVQCNLNNFAIDLKEIEQWKWKEPEILNHKSLHNIVEHFVGQFNNDDKNNFSVPGKTIIYADSKYNASIITDLLNQIYPEKGERYAELVSADIKPDNISRIIHDFRYNKFPQIVVNINMLEKGFDFSNVINIVLCKKIKSSQQIYQILSSGARNSIPEKKEKLFVFDYCNNEKVIMDWKDDFNSKNKSSKRRDPYSQYLPFKTKSALYIEVGFTGDMITVSDYLNEWEGLIRSLVTYNPLIKKIEKGISITQEEQVSLFEVLNNNKYYFNEANLKKAYNNSYITLTDFVLLALGVIKPKEKTKIFEEAYEMWQQNKHFHKSQVSYLNILKNICIKKGRLDMKNLSTIHNLRGLGEHLFGIVELKKIVKEIYNIYSSTMLMDEGNEII